MRRHWSRYLALVGTAATAVVFSLSPTGATLAAGPSAGSVAPNATNMVDCHGWSPMYKPVKAGLGGDCADLINIEKDGSAYRFLDNGHYVGHDEPSVKFISSAAGSASTQQYLMRLAVDPKATPTVNSPRVAKYAQLSPAPWFGLPICDPKSYPQNPCAPDSDANSGAINDPNGAGSAFLELQFYAPGFAPFIDGPSCDATRYCAALTIDSVECTFGFATCNNNCIEPVNFAYLQMNGVPAGPPSPQLANVSTFSPNRQTLMMNQGDVLAVTITDTPAGLLTRISDLSTGRSGFMVASAANGFMNTNIADCSGTPFTFHPEYSSALQQNQVPWTALETGVLMQQELGHFEPCSSVASSFPVNLQFADGQSFSDPNVFQVCQGGLEKGSTGEGPCDPNTGVCVGATAEGGGPCPSNNFASGFNCEFSDANCMPAGKRTIVVNGQTQSTRWPIAGCQDNVFQNGDLDFDGSSYQADFPDGQAGHPTSFQYIGPFDARGSSFPTVQFETNVGASETLCNTQTGAGCTTPPAGAAFYPFWTLGSLGKGSGQLGSILNHVCVWNFGNVIPGVTRQDFGRTAEYGTPNTARFAGTSISAPAPNPQFNGSCRI
jgi:hypothetical protein